MTMVAFQLMGAVAIVVGLLGTWLAARRRMGWLLCILSSGLWFPALVSGNQWVAVANCCLSVGICVRNFRTQAEAGSSSQGTRVRQPWQGSDPADARPHVSVTVREPVRAGSAR